MDDTEIMLSYSTTADSQVHVFERDGKGDLVPVATNQKYPPKIIENGKEANILPAGVDNLAKLRQRQEKLEKALDLQKTVEVYQSKTHIVETLAGASVGAIEGAAVGMVTVSPEAGAAIGSVEGGVRSYEASKADAKETIEVCSQLRDDILKDLGVNIQEAEIEADTIRQQIGKSNSDERTVYSDAEDRRGRY